MTFYFAWVEESSDMSFTSQYHVEDEDVFAFEVTHQEGEFARLAVDIRNPKVGLLGEGRERWAWLSWQKNESEVVPLFLGRLVGLPSDLVNEVVTLEFEARPEHFEEEKAALAETLKVAPYWDPVFINEDALDDPDKVLEGRSAMWHISRAGGAVTVSDIVSGEAGTVNIGVDDAFYDGLSVEIGDQPIRIFEMEAVVDWNQVAVGEVDLRDKLSEAFAASGSEDGLIMSYTGQGLEASWPQPDTSIGGGWSVSQSQLTLLSGDGATEEYFDAKTRESLLEFMGILDQFKNWGNSSFGFRPTAVGLPPDPDTARFYRWTFYTPAFSVAYAANRSRSETVRFSVRADTQEVVTGLDDNGPIERLALRSSSIAVPVDNVDTADGELPIYDVRRRSYFKTDRGKRTFEWLLAVARARLLKSARAAEVSTPIKFEQAVDLSCRHNAIITDPRLPGGQAAGKVIGYGFSANGDSGLLLGHIVIGCALGGGSTLAAINDGDPLYVEDGYVANGYQQRSGAEVEPFTDELRYSDYDLVEINDDGVDFLAMDDEQAVESIVVTNGLTAQESVLGEGDGVVIPFEEFRYEGSFADTPTAVSALNEVPTKVALTLKPVTGGPFNTGFAPVISDLVIPKQIDLSASSE